MRRLWLVLAILAPALHADVILFHGRVTMADGAPPTQSVGIEYACPGKTRQVIAITGKTGAYLWKYQGTAFDFDGGFLTNDVSAVASAANSMAGPGGVLGIGGGKFLQQQLRATRGALGFISSTIDLSDRNWGRSRTARSGSGAPFGERGSGSGKPHRAGRGPGAGGARPEGAPGPQLGRSGNATAGGGRGVA